AVVGDGGIDRTRPGAKGTRTTMQPARQATRREPVHSDAALSNSARDGIRTDRGGRKGAKLRGFGGSPGEANRRALGRSRDLSDPRLAAVPRTIARRPGGHALVQALA